MWISFGSYIKICSKEKGQCKIALAVTLRFVPKKRENVEQKENKKIQAHTHRHHTSCMLVCKQTHSGTRLYVCVHARHAHIQTQKGSYALEQS